MRDTEVLVRFRPSGREVYVLRGTRLIEAAACAGVVIDAACGGQGTCGKCRLMVTSGAGEPTAAERDHLSDQDIGEGWRLACQAAVAGATEVDLVPAGQTFLPAAGAQASVGRTFLSAEDTQAAGHKILVHCSAVAPCAVDPPVRKRYVELPPPARGDDLPDALRLERALDEGPLDIPLSMLRELPAALREADFRGTAVLGDHSCAGGPDIPVCRENDRDRGRQECLPHQARLLDFEQGNSEAEGFAAAFDVGTTTLAGMLLDLRTGEERAVVSRLNPQTRFGDDVLSRILHVREQSDGLAQLHREVVAAIDEMIGELCQKAGTARHRIYELTAAGNTTMQQLLCGVDPGPLGETPFVPAGGHGMSWLARELGLHVHPRGGAYVMPVIGGFVGGDTVAGIVSTGMSEADRPSLLIDIGTNGEIVLLAGGTLRAASTAAGPAFEGARISCGMRGSAGAIEKIVFDGRLRINVIGGVPPTGLCGSGLIDVTAELLRHGLLTPQGRLVAGGADIPACEEEGRSAGRQECLPRHQERLHYRELAARITMQDGQASFLLAGADETGHGRPIALSQRDFREVQLAAGAIRAGIAILLRRAGLEPKDLDQVLIGGGFGNFIRRSNAQRIGLLPREVPHRRIRYMGNTSLAGACRAALSCGAREAAEEIARRTEHVDLSADPAFQRAFAESMLFPEV